MSEGKQYWLTKFPYRDDDDCPDMHVYNNKPLMATDCIHVIEFGVFAHALAIHKDILQYCKPHVNQMWAATIVAKILDCDFKDVHTKLKELEGLGVKL